MGTIIKRTINDENDKPGFGINIEIYNSAMDVVADCRTRKITDERFNNMQEQSLRRSWHSVGTYDEALDLLHDGYEPQISSVELSKIAATSEVEKHISFSNNIVGFAPVVPLALKGVPNCMIDTRIKTMKAKVIDLYYETTHSSSTDQKDIIKDGEKILGAIIAMEKKGYRINLYAMQSYTRDGSSDILIIKIKSSNQPFDLKRMSYPLMHPAFFRVIGFDWYSKVPGGKYRYGYGHWFSYDFEKKTADRIHELFGRNAVYVSGMEIGNKDQKYIEEALSNIA